MDKRPSKATAVAAALGVGGALLVLGSTGQYSTTDSTELHVSSISQVRPSSLVAPQPHMLQTGSVERPTYSFPLAPAARSSTRQHGGPRPGMLLMTPEEELAVAKEEAAEALKKGEVLLTWLLGDDAQDMNVEKAGRAVKKMHSLVMQRKADVVVTDDSTEARDLVQEGEKKQQIVFDVLAALLKQAKAQEAVDGVAAPNAPIVNDLGNDVSTGVWDPKEASQAASKALDTALERAQPIFQWLLGNEEARDITRMKAEKCKLMVDDLIKERKAAVKTAEDPLFAEGLVEKAEKKLQLVENVLSSMALKEEAKKATGIRSSAPEAPASAVASTSAPSASASAPVPAAKTVDRNDSQVIAQKAYDKAYARAEVLLMWILGKDAKDMTIEKAEKAVKAVEDLLSERKAAEATAADREGARALVLKAEKKLELLGDVLTTMKALKSASGEAVSVEAVSGDPEAETAKPVEASKPLGNLKASKELANAADKAVATAMDKSEVILEWLLGDDAQDMTRGKALHALNVVEKLIEKRKGDVRTARDPVAAEGLVAKAERKHQLITNLLSAMAAKEDADAALGLPPSSMMNSEYTAPVIKKDPKEVASDFAKHLKDPGLLTTVGKWVAGAMLAVAYYIIGQGLSISGILGLVSISIWIVAQLPQILKNQKRKKADDLSLDFLGLWMVGDLCNLASCFLVGATLTQKVLGAYFVLADGVLLAQWKLFATKSTEVGMSNNSKKFWGAFGVAAAVGLASCLLRGLTGAMTGDYLGWVSAAVYLVARVPQIYKNFNTRKVGDLSVYLFALAVLGNVTYAGSILAISMSGDWLRLQAPFLLGSIGTLLFDALLVYQIVSYPKQDKQAKAPLLA